jgi:hypothetical protein
MTDSCPILPALADETATRLGAGLTLALVLGALALGRPWLPLLLAADFALRSRGWTAASPVALAAQGLRTLLGLRPRPVNAGPKRFAARIGAGFALAMGLALALHAPGLALGLGLALALCAALEGFLGFCVGCKVYSLLHLGAGSRR